MKSFANVSMIKTMAGTCDKSDCGWGDPGMYNWVDAWILAIEVVGVYKKENLNLKEYGLFFDKTEAEDAVLEYALRLQSIGFPVRIMDDFPNPGRDLRTKIEVIGGGRFFRSLIPRSFDLRPIKGGD